MKDPIEPMRATGTPLAPPVESDDSDIAAAAKAIKKKVAGDEPEPKKKRRAKDKAERAGSDKSEREDRPAPTRRKDKEDEAPRRERKERAEREEDPVGEDEDDPSEDDEEEEDDEPEARTRKPRDEEDDDDRTQPDADYSREDDEDEEDDDEEDDDEVLARQVDRFKTHFEEEHEPAPRKREPAEEPSPDDSAPDKPKSGSEKKAPKLTDPVFTKEDLAEIDEVVPEPLSKLLSKVNEKVGLMAKLLDAVRTYASEDLSVKSLQGWGEVQEFLTKRRSEGFTDLYGRRADKLTEAQDKAIGKLMTTAVNIQKEARQDRRNPEHIPLSRALEIAERGLFGERREKAAKEASRKEFQEQIKKRHRKLDLTPRASGATRTPANDVDAAAAGIRSFMAKRRR